MRDVRRFVVSAVIGSFSLAALMGIVALLSPGRFGDTEARVLGTTASVGVESVAALCYLSVSGRRRWAWLGVAGAAVSLVALTSLLITIWGSVNDGVGRTFASSAVVAATLAQASLLIALAARRGTTRLLVGTLGAAGVVAGMVVVPILTRSEPPGGYFRLLGVIAILDALGSVALVALSVVARFTRAGQVGPVAAGPVILAPDVEARLRRLALERGRTPSDLLDEALDAVEHDASAQAS